MRDSADTSARSLGQIFAVEARAHLAQPDALARQLAGAACCAVPPAERMAPS